MQVPRCLSNPWQGKDDAEGSTGGSMGCRECPFAPSVTWQ